MYSEEQAGIPRPSSPQQLELDRLTAGLLAASAVITQPRKVIGAKVAALTPDVDLRTPRHAVAKAIEFVREPVEGDAPRGIAFARRFAIAAAAVIALAVAGAVRAR